MTGIDQGDGPFPTIVAAGTFGQYIAKSNSLDSGARHWSLYTDGKTVIMVFHPDRGGGDLNHSGYSYVVGFGDLLSPVPDPYATICGGLSSSSSNVSTIVNCGFLIAAGGNEPRPNSGTGWNALARTYTSAKKPVWSTAHLGMGFPQVSSMGVTGGMRFPDGMSNRFALAQIMVYEPTGAGAVMRGQLPLYECAVGAVHANREIINNVIGREGRAFQYIRAGSANINYVGGAYIDLTGNSQGKWS